MFDVINDTIVAVASPPGFGERGIVRCSGPEAWGIAEGIFRADSGERLSEQAGFRRLGGTVELEPGCGVAGEVYLSKAPRSYTRQDCVEFHVPGAPAVLTMLVERMIEGGARAAEPGEFTARAYLSGAMDLTRVEAVAAVIRARSDAQLRAAQRLADGRLAVLGDSILDQLAELVALVEADIDFAEEPIEFITPVELRSRLEVICGRLRGLLERAEASERVDVLPRVLLIGEPNAGKSTLMNRLTGIDRAICSPVAGTTRDLLSAPVRLGRGEAVLLDAAGVEDGMSGLLREAAAITADTAKTSDALCLVVDASRDVDRQVFAAEDAARDVPCVVVANKIDLLDSATVVRCLKTLEAAGRGPVCAVSARTGEGVEACRQLIADVVDLAETAVGGDTILTTARHREAVEAALGALQRCADETGGIDETIDRADILAFELREALEALGSVAGSVTTDDLLGRVFSSFCIGK